jgi:hypothetical protein
LLIIPWMLRVLMVLSTLLVFASLFIKEEKYY